MGLTLIAAAAAAPVGLEEAKGYCKIETDADDAIVLMLISAATGTVETFLGKAVTQQQWMLTLPAFTDEIELHPGAVVSIDSIEYLDEARVRRVLDPDIYILDTISQPSRLVLDPDQAWPATADSRIPGVIEVTFTTGPEEADPRVKAAVMALVAQWNDNRIPGDMPSGVRSMLQPLRRMIL